MEMARKRKKTPRNLLLRVSLFYAVGALGSLAILTSAARLLSRPDTLSQALAAAQAAEPVAIGPNLPGKGETPLVILDHPPADPDWRLFHPAWIKPEINPLLQVRIEMTDKIELAGQQIAALVDDPKGRVDADFKVPTFLHSRVMFWMQVYAQFNSHTRIVHDRENPARIYGYIDFRSVYREADSNAEAERQCNRIEKKIFKGLKARLLEAAGAENSGLLAPEEKAKLQLLLSQYGVFSVKDTESLLKEIRTQSGQSDYFLLALYRSRNLLPHIESVFRQHGLPVGLARVPFVESSFNYRANSKGGAMGIWQFMPETAKQMIRGNESRAWSDPLKQTESAAKIFKIYRSLLPDWGTTVTAYNSGVGRLARMVKKAHAKNLDGVLQLPAADGLGFAGKNFLSEVMAANLVEAYKDELFKQWMEPADPALVFRDLQPFPRNYCDM
jgi:membrane-bound lytic murein transglycosylase D